MADPALDNVSPIRPDLRVVERRVVDTDNGFTRIANELLEAVIGAGLTQNQLLITLAVIRKTYGYNKASDWVGNAQLSDLTGLPLTRCSTERNKLIKMGVLTQEGRLVGINKEVSAWQVKVNGIGKPDITETVTFTESVNPTLQNLLTTKDNSTIDNKDNNNITPVVPEPSKPAKDLKRATQYPTGLIPNEGNIKLAEKLGVDSAQEFDAFSDYHRSKGSTFKDWNLAFNTWLRGSVKFSPKKPCKPSQTSARSVPENFNGKDYGETQIPNWMEG